MITALAQYRGRQAAQKMSPQELDESIVSEECLAWGYDPNTPLGKAWMSGFCDVRAEILEGFYKESPDE